MQYVNQATVHRITDRQILYNYIHGGSAVIIMEGPAGTRHTYLIERPRDTSSFPDDVYFVYAVHDNHTRFYIGMIEGDKFRVTQHSRFLPDTDIVKGAKYLVNLCTNRFLLAKTPMKIYNGGRCARCGRILESDKTREIGFGNKCYRRLAPMFFEWSNADA